MEDRMQNVYSGSLNDSDQSSSEEETLLFLLEHDDRQNDSIEQRTSGQSALSASDNRTQSSTDTDEEILQPTVEASCSLLNQPRDAILENWQHRSADFPDHQQDSEDENFRLIASIRSLPDDLLQRPEGEDLNKLLDSKCRLVKLIELSSKADGQKYQQQQWEEVKQKLPVIAELENFTNSTTGSLPNERNMQMFQSHVSQRNHTEFSGQMEERDFENLDPQPSANRNVEEQQEPVEDFARIDRQSPDFVLMRQESSSSDPQDIRTIGDMNTYWGRFNHTVPGFGRLVQTVQRLMQMNNTPEHSVELSEFNLRRESLVTNVGSKSVTAPHSSRIQQQLRHLLAFVSDYWDNATAAQDCSDRAWFSNFRSDLLVAFMCTALIIFAIAVCGGMWLM